MNLRIKESITSFNQRFQKIKNYDYTGKTKQAFRSFIKPILPKYQVVFTMYHVIPGQPVDRHFRYYHFDKGESRKARDFFEKVVNSTHEYKVLPSEVRLKRRGRTLKKEVFGPVKDIKKYAIAD